MLSSVTNWIAGARKAVASAVGTAITLLTAYHALSFLPEQGVVAAILGALTVVVTYLVPNKTA